MTEVEYVEHIRKIAQAYMDSFSPTPLHRSDRERWQTVKQYLSPETAIALCDAWLAGEGTGAPKASDGTDGT
jgi:hypothetical protein